MEPHPTGWPPGGSNAGWPFDASVETPQAPTPTAPPPPPVAPAYPNTPTGTPEVLARGHDRWRPSRRQVTLTASFVAVIALVAGSVAAVRHQQHAHDLDRAAANAVQLLLTARAAPADLLTSESGEVQLAVRNEGPDPVHVRSVRLDGGTVVPVSIGSDLPPDNETTVSLPDGTACPPDAGRAGKHTVNVSLTTYRGKRLSRTYSLSGAAIDQRERHRCGTLLPAEAFAGTVTTLQQQGDWVRLTINLRNLSVLPLSLRTLRAPAGIAIQAPSLPLDLPPSAVPGEGGPSTVVTLRLRLADCKRYNETLLGEQPGRSGLSAGLTGRFENGTGTISLEDDVPNDGGFALDPQTTLMGACPDLFFG
ncbi:MAG: hypothetical protein M3P04_03865 [Actinomycetota bacterium]|nr:hypothetical protein [Actinomycetota bacterium]